MWGVIYVAHSKNEATRIKQTLEDDGIIARTREVLSGRDNGALIEILVMETDIANAYEIILSI
ncbi:MAG: glutamate decarboxylase [Clostridium sp.]